MTLHRPDISLLISLLGSLLLFVLGAILPACGHLSDSSNPARQSLRRIAEIVADNPHRALDSLKAIDYSRLSASDRHYYDFLSVKGADKAYITHTSDSLILDVIDYYSSHQTEELYPEALYYGGRVYSDLGDYPTALRYFQQTLALLPAEAEQKNLRRRVLSQTGRLLSTLRLYSQAIPYIEESIRLDEMEKDSLSIMHDTQLLGTTYLRLKEWDKAETQFREAYRLAQSFTMADIARQKMYIATTKYQKGELDSTRLYMTGVLDHISPTDRHAALSYLGYIYLNSNRPDSAYLAAMELIKSNELTNKDKGYYILTSPLMAGMIDQDSVITYLRDYHRLLNQYLNTNSNQQSLLQHSSYNYSLHEREREKAENAYSSLIKVIIFGLIALPVMVSILLGWGFYKRGEIIRINHALDLLRTLPFGPLNLPLHQFSQGRILSGKELKDSQVDSRNEIEGKAHQYLCLPAPVIGETPTPVSQDSQSHQSALENTDEYTEVSPSDSLSLPPVSLTPFSLDPIGTDNPNSLKKLLIEELTINNNSLTTPYIVPNPILLSEVYGSLVNYIHHESPVPVQSDIWGRLEKVVSECFPDFKLRLNILTGGKLKKDEFRFTLLIKCDFSSSQIAILQGRGRSTIVYRHRNFSIKIFGKKVPLSTIRRLIQEL